MKKLNTKSTLAALLAAATVATGGEAMAIEEPRYQVVEREENFELRRYAPRIVAEVEIEADFEEAGNRGFRPLANFIFGDNVSAQKIAMTAPVTQQPGGSGERDGQKIAMTAPVTQQGQGEKHIVHFAMPAAFTMDNIPKPRDSRVKLRQIEPRTYAVIRYSGFWSKSNYDEHLSKLNAEIEERGLQASGDPIWARYNAPITPWFLRRNEIMVPIKSYDQ